MEPQHARLPLWEDKSVTEKVETLYEMVNALYAYALYDARVKVLAILDQHQATDQMEADDVGTMRRLILQYPTIFNMNCEIGHLTGSGLVVDLNAGRFLLHYHRYLNLWLPFGGHPDFETDMSLVALRESMEESGLTDLKFFPPSESPLPLDLDVHTIPASNGRPEHLHLDFRYLLVTEQPEKLHAGTDESDQFVWVGFDEAGDFEGELDPALKRLIGKAGRIVDKFL